MNLTQNYKFVKFGPKSETYSSFYQIWLLEQMERAYYN